MCILNVLYTKKTSIWKANGLSRIIMMWSWIQPPPTGRCSNKDFLSLQKIWWAKTTANALFFRIPMNQTQRQVLHTLSTHSPDQNQASNRWRSGTRPYKCVLRISAKPRMSIGDDAPGPFPAKWHREDTWPCLQDALFPTWPRVPGSRPRRTWPRDTKRSHLTGKRATRLNTPPWWKITEDKTMGFWVI